MQENTTVAVAEAPIEESLSITFDHVPTNDTATSDQRPSDELHHTAQSIWGKRIARSIAVAFGEQLLFRVLGFLANVALARLLLPEMFGIFALLQSFVSSANFIADFGLSASLVQQKDELTLRDLRTVFTVQFILYGVAALILFLLAPIIVTIYKLDPAAAWLFRAHSFYLIISVFRNVTSVQLSRRLLYTRLVIPDIAEKLTYWCIAVALAYLGFGAWALVSATLASAMVGTSLIFGRAPWRVGFALDRAALRGIGRFAVPYQGIRVLGMIRGLIGPSIAGVLVGTAGLGYIGFAGPLVAIPAMVAGLAQGFMFPAFARLQGDRIGAGKVFDGFMRLTSLTVYPLGFIMLGIAPQLVHVVYSEKWAPAIPVLMLALVGLWSLPFGGAALYNLLIGLGELRTAFTLVALWLVLDLVVVVPCIAAFGYVGSPLGYLLADVSLLVAIPQVRKVCDFHVLRNVTPGFVAGLVAFAVAKAASVLVSGIPGLVAATLLGALAALVTLFVGWRHTLRADLATNWAHLRSQGAS